jgi:hypothetical protein
MQFQLHIARYESVKNSSKRQSPNLPTTWESAALGIVSYVANWILQRRALERRIHCT